MVQRAHTSVRTMPPRDTALLDRVTKRYGWPDADKILNPAGAGPARHAQLVRQKIETALCRLPDAGRARVGILTRDAGADATEDPLAIVCYFPATVSSDSLTEAHRLAWSFSRARVLLIVEPGLLRVWTCCEAPRKPTDEDPLPAEVASLSIDAPAPSAAAGVAQSLEWVRFASGALVQEVPERFQNKERADRTLLKNLKVVRNELLRETPQRPKLLEDITHDLLARVIFVQFLFHRKDSKGRPALGEREFTKLAADGTLSQRYHSFGAILRNYVDAYALFRWLDGRFNGDLFPGKDNKADGPHKAAPEEAWKEEMRQVKEAHLCLLADLVDGRLTLGSRKLQLHLWPLYAFDAIPLDFISSIYEEFVGEGKGVHYTPHHLVDFVLDGVLPWNGKTWDLKVLDPACGSGIFLVKVYQRLVHRWRTANPGKTPRGQFLRGLLEHNIFGVDIDPDAVRVASLSLYLAMCDEIDPRQYWRTVRLPCLRGKRLVHSDFFDEAPGFNTKSDRPSYDLVVGNAPWGEETMTPAAETWATKHAWEVPNKSIGPLFLAKGAELTHPNGFVAMLQPAGALLFNRSKVVCDLRRKLFETYEVEEVTDFSALRRNVFEHSVAPVCTVLLQPHQPDDSTVLFARPSARANGSSLDTIIIEANNVHHVEKDEAARDPWVWSVLSNGSRRDLELLSRLAKLPKLESIIDKSRMGIVRGSDPERRRSESTILGRRILESASFPESTFLVLDMNDLEPNKDPYVTAKDSSSLLAFAAPQMLIKMTWRTGSRRYRAAVVDTHGEAEGALCSQSYVSVRIKESKREFLNSACLTLNSSLAVYFLFLTGSSSIDYIPKAQTKELLSVPLPRAWTGDLRTLKKFADVDREVFKLFDLRETDRVLVDDFLERFDGTSKDLAPDLDAYCEQLVQTLGCAGLLGTAVILELASDLDFPLRVIVLYLQRLPGLPVQTEIVTGDELSNRLLELDRNFLRANPTGAGGVLFHRIARIYDIVVVQGVRVPAVYLVKPNRRDCWSRSAALQDADEIVADALYSNSFDNEPEASSE